MTTPDLHNYDPDNDYRRGDIEWHLAAAEWWLQSAHSVDNDEHYHGDEPVADGDVTQDTHVTKHASLAAAHAAIAQALVACAPEIERLAAERANRAKVDKLLRRGQ